MKRGRGFAYERIHPILIALTLSCISCVTAEEPPNAVRYVDSESYSGGNIIRLTSIADFEFLANRENITVIFVKSIDPRQELSLERIEWFFPARNGEIYVVDAQGYRTIQDRDDGKNAGFPNGNTYYAAAELGIDSFALYDYFMKNSFLTVDDARRSLALGFQNMSESSIPPVLPLRISTEHLDGILRPLYEAHRRRTSVQEPPVTLLSIEDEFRPVDKLLWMLSTDQFPQSTRLQRDSRNSNSSTASVGEVYRLGRVNSGDDEVALESYASYVAYADKMAVYFKELPDDNELRLWGYSEEDRSTISGIYRSNRNMSRDAVALRVLGQNPDLYGRILDDAYARNLALPNMAEILPRPLLDSDWYYSFVLLEAQSFAQYQEQATAMARGFAEPAEYQRALELGFNRKREYLESRERGLDTKDDLDASNALATNDRTIILEYRELKKTFEEVEELTSFESLGDCYVFFIVSRLSAGDYSVEKIKAEMDSYAADLYYEANTNEYRDLYSRWHSGQNPRQRTGRINILQVIDERITSVSTGRIQQILSWQIWDEYGSYDSDKRIFTKRGQ